MEDPGRNNPCASSVTAGIPPTSPRAVAQYHRKLAIGHRPRYRRTAWRAADHEARSHRRPPVPMMTRWNENVLPVPIKSSAETKNVKPWGQGQVGARADSAAADTMPDPGAPIPVLGSLPVSDDRADGNSVAARLNICRVFRLRSRPRQEIFYAARHFIVRFHLKFFRAFEKISSGDRALWYARNAY